MTGRLVVEISADGAALLTAESARSGEPAGSAAFTVRPVLDRGDAEDLRWYFEDYLRAPYAVYEERGQDIARNLSRWGAALFDSVLGRAEARYAYDRFRAADAGEPGEIVIRSTDPGWLGVPWELMRDPAHAVPIALEGISFARSTSEDIGGEHRVMDDRLRILLVISRPSGKTDIGYRMIARAVIDRVEQLRRPIDVTVLRPPTFAAFTSAVDSARAAGKPFHIVHFDGHGAFTADGGGALVFERPVVGAQAVPARRIAQTLQAGQVPIVVLNACNSGAVGKQLEASVASAILAHGAVAVLAMAYTVYAVAAAEFMGGFYERLFDGAAFSAAVRAGRARMRANAARPSPKGPAPLEDWCIPVLYRRCEVVFPRLAARHSECPATSARPAKADLAAVAGIFVGRDNYFYEIESAVRHGSVLLLHGPAGSGKTELAKAFARWWRHTGGVARPDGVILYSLESAASGFRLENLATAVGLMVEGAEFAALPPQERVRRVREILCEQRLLLILDNFETVASLPDPTAATPALDEAGRGRLREFLETISLAAQSVVLVTSRNPEQWLGIDVQRIAVGGLADEEAQTYADHLLAGLPNAEARREHRDFADLMRWLDGNPLAMRLTLPHLAYREPADLLATLRASLASHAPAAPVDPDASEALTAGLRFSLTHLTAVDRRLFLALGMFHGTADSAVLAELSNRAEAPERFRGVDPATWKTALEHGVAAGILTSNGGSLYRIHPALPLALAEQWRAQAPETYRAERTATESALLSVFASMATALHQQIRGGDIAAALRTTDHHLGNLSHFLGYALQQQHWDSAHCIVRPLTAYWDNRQQFDEAAAWTLRIRRAPTESDRTSQAHRSLWLYVVSAHADRQVGAGQLDDAAGSYTEIAQRLRAHPDDEHALAQVEYQLARIAQQRGDLAAANTGFEDSLAAAERHGDDLGLAYSNHQLGNIALLRSDFRTARKHYEQALAQFEELGDPMGIAGSHYQLASAAQQSGDLTGADAHYRRALDPLLRTDNQPKLAAVYHQLAVLSDLRGDLPAAEQWCRKSLTIKEQINDQPGLAPTYSMLGLLAYRQRHLDDAERWTQRSLDVAQAIDSRREVADCYHQLCLVALARGDHAAARSWGQQSLDLARPDHDATRLASALALLSLCSDDAAALAYATEALALLQELPPHPAIESQRATVQQRITHLTALRKPNSTDIRRPE